MPKIKCQASLKVQALTRLLQDNESISSICEDLKISPVVLGQWRREAIGGLPLVFDKSLKKVEREKERRIDELRQEVARKQEVIGELMEAFTLSKKAWGELTGTWVDLTNPLNLENAFRSMKKTAITRVTLGKYWRFLEEKFLIHKVRRYDVKGRDTSTPLLISVC